MTGRLDTVGIDLVAMCADDVVCTGAEPLFFLDYLAVGRVVPERVAAVVEGVAEGCRRAGCALLGGETAEHPGVMAEDAFDLAGFCVGRSREADLLGPDRVREGDVLVGLAVERPARERLLPRAAGPRGHGPVPVARGLGRPLADELLEPCRIHAPQVLALHREGLLHAAAHITGGGFFENLPRALPPGLGAELRPRELGRAAGLRLAPTGERGHRRRHARDVQPRARDGARGAAPEDADRVIGGGPHGARRVGTVVTGAPLRIT